MQGKLCRFCSQAWEKTVEGMLKIKKSGGFTIAQDEDTSVVWGMPKAAIDIDAHNEIVPLTIIPNKINELSKIRLNKSPI